MEREQLTQSHFRQVDAHFFRQKIVLVFITSFTLGVFVSSFFFIPPLVSVLVFIISVSICVAEKIWHKKVYKETILIAVVLFSVSLGMLRYSVKDFHVASPHIETSVGENVELVGVVVSETEMRENSSAFVLECTRLLGEDGRRDCGGERVLVSADLYTHSKYGDEVRVEGKLGKPGLINDGVGRPFDYAKYLSKDDIYFTVSFAETEVLSSGHGHSLKHALFSVKRNFVNQVKEIFSEPQASLLAGLVVSGKEAMPKDILEEFRRAGVVHIVVLSGYNITIIAEFMRRMFEHILLWTRLGARPALAAGASIAGIILFVLMTGAEATVVRASLMVLVVIAAKLFGREYSASRALLAAAFLMIVHNPKILVYDPSFQLSFIATTALIYVVPIVERYLGWVTARWQVRNVLATTLGTQLAVLPLLVYSMGDVSLVSLPANMLILLTIPITMLLGFMAAVVSYLSTIMAIPIAYGAHILLSWILLVSATLGNLPFASVRVPVFPLLVMVILYLSLTTAVWRLRSYPHRSASLGS